MILSKDLLNSDSWVRESIFKKTFLANKLPYYSPHRFRKTLARAMKALSIIDATCIAVTGDGEKVYLEAMDPEVSTKSTYKVDVAETDKTFKYIFKAENLKLLPDDYQVQICGRGISHFKSNDVEYWIAFLA